METKELKKTISLTDVANVIDTLNLEVVQDSLQMQEWLAIEGKIEPMYEASLEKARKNLELNSGKWNEEELKMKFISVVMNASEVENNKLAVFYERPLEGNLQGYEFSVICDCMIGTSTAGGRPKAPYFFLQEFKKGKGDRTDAEAQALVAMLLAQKENNDNKPLYGAWLIGENWHFTTLQDREYCVSRQYVATNPDDLQKIVYLLQFFKKFGS